MGWLARHDDDVEDGDESGEEDGAHYVTENVAP